MSKSLLTAALNDPDAPKADFALHSRRMPSSQVEDVLATLEIAASSSLNARANYLSVTPGSLAKSMSKLSQGSYGTSMVGPSPTFATLHQLHRVKLQEDSAAGQEMRRKSLRGAVIVFFTAGYSGKRFIFEKAHALGVRTVVVDGPDSWAKDMVEEGIAEKFIAVDMRDADSVFDRTLAAIKEMEADGLAPDGVCTFNEMSVPVAARLAEALGLPGNTVAAVDAARDKHATRKIMQEAGLPTPGNILITDASQLGEAAEKVGFPAVIKPIAGAGSMGVVRVDDAEGLAACYKKVINDMGRAVITSGALVYAPEDGQTGESTKKFDVLLMMEQYLDGPEVDVDIVLSDGKAVYAEVTDNWPTIEPYFQEVGANCPSVLSREHQDELIKLSIDATLSLGFTCGVFHVESKYTTQGARLIEVNCRMGGMQVRNINLLTWGVDLVEEHLFTVVGLPARPQKAPEPLTCISEMAYNAPKTGRMADLSFLDEWKTHPAVISARPLVAAGELVTGPEAGMPTWYAEIVVSFPSVKEGMDFLYGIDAQWRKDGGLPIVPK